MRTTLVLIAVACLTSATLAQSPTQEKAAPAQAAAAQPSGLKMPPAATVKAGSGYMKLQAAASGPVAYEVFAVGASGVLQLQTDTFGSTIVIGIPAVPAAIRITAACACEPGKPPVIASTVITVEGAAGPAPQVSGGTSEPTKPEPTQPQPVAGGNGLHVTVVGLPESAALRQALEGAGYRYWPYATGDPKLQARPDLQKQLLKIGSLPAVIVQDGSGKVLRAVKIKTEDDVAQVVNGLEK